MRRSILSLALSASAMLILASAGSAAIYTVTLQNGATFDTRYQPQHASWDESKIVILSEFGNVISFSKDEVVSVKVDTETRGFGHQLDDTTIAMGWAPNDAIDPNSDEGRAAIAAEQAAAAQQANAPQVYNQNQFVEPASLTGLPVWMTGVNAVPQVAPQPVDSAPPPPNQ
ncbi:MAG: hypothetical protein AB7G12_10640 [Thermoanaerobaculia bacterium]